jgi:hypothetical protein
MAVPKVVDLLVCFIFCIVDRLTYLSSLLIRLTCDFIPVGVCYLIAGIFRVAPSLLRSAFGLFRDALVSQVFAAYGFAHSLLHFSHSLIELTFNLILIHEFTP